MWNKPTIKQLEKIPLILSNEFKHLKDTKVYLHFFIGGSDWYITQYDGKDTFYGFACLNGDLEMAEWGYISFTELINLRVSGAFHVDRDKHFKPCKAINVPLIAKAHKWDIS